MRWWSGHTQGLAGGHEWHLGHSHIKCNKCWIKLSGQSSKEALTALQVAPCHFGPSQAADDMKVKPHLSHQLMRRGAHLECQPTMWQNLDPPSKSFACTLGVAVTREGAATRDSLVAVNCSADHPCEAQAFGNRGASAGYARHPRRHRQHYRKEPRKQNTY